MLVEVSGYKFTFPQQCACCGSKPDTALTVSASKSSGKRVVRIQTNTWDFPYCSQCKEHSKGAEALKPLVKFVVIPLLVVSLSVESYSGYFIFMMVVGTVFLYIKLMNRAKSLLKVGCVCTGKAVGFLGWDGTLQMFEIVSDEYARKFMIANSSKLINLSPKAQQLLGNSGYKNQANSAQSARRYRKRRWY